MLRDDAATKRRAVAGRAFNFDIIAPSRCVQYSYTCHTKQPQRISSRGRCGYVSQRRLESAKAMIATGRASLGEIALDCQFSSQSSFTRAFRRATGMTPAEYRRTLR
ncbi:MAG: helix-turn-helix transcriptional regulator [Xanthobacteraceae bacterium]